MDDGPQVAPGAQVREQGHDGKVTPRRSHHLLCWCRRRGEQAGVAGHSMGGQEGAPTATGQRSACAKPLHVACERGRRSMVRGLCVALCRGFPRCPRAAGEGRVHSAVSATARTSVSSSTGEFKGSSSLTSLSMVTPSSLVNSFPFVKHAHILLPV